MIFAAIAIAWLAYLVPHFVRRRDDDVVEEAHPADRFSDSVRIVRHGTAPLLDQDLSVITEYEVSTPVTRRAAIGDLRRMEKIAASRRRRVLSGLLALVCAGVSVASMHWLPWWSVAVPGGLVVVFVVVSRISVKALRRSLDARYVDICRGSSESTIFLSRKDASVTAPKKGKGAAKADAAEAKPGLWDPVPITLPTYVSKPLAPRTVRTIDLSGPGVTSSARPELPVTADAPPAAEKPEQTRESDGDAQAASA